MKDVMTDSPTNAHEYTVSELAFSLKKTVEETYGRVRVRGELGRVTIAKSGHCYLDVKDDKAVINSIIWKGVMSRLPMRPEEGMEVICDGKLSTYPGRSNYQLVIDNMELAGAGALMALFDKRKKMLAAEGLFEAEHKVDLPFMPKTIGVVTSPTGAVIRDILHRISDRFPSHVLVWPVLVQGDKAAEQIASAITGFNHADGFARPDVLIVARGGGSMEDLWCFNEEIVVRAAAASKIPLISAVGHETDWTLIDYVADYRAPTPTGAAEVAVPVRDDWLETLADYGLRITRGLRRNTTEKTTALSAARLPRLENVLAAPRQRLDLAIAKLPRAQRLLEPLRQKLTLITARLNLGRLTDRAGQQLAGITGRLHPALRANQRRHTTHFDDVSRRLRREPLDRQIERQEQALSALSRAAQNAMIRDMDQAQHRLAKAGQLLDAYSYQGVLARGYALVSRDTGDVVRSKDGVSAGDVVTLTFADGDRSAVIAGGTTAKSQPPAKKKTPKKTPSANNQADLF